jgi:ABC-type transport system involved in multi-copper enzyme maturation permease subunit
MAEYRSPSSHRVVGAVGWVTFTEIVRDKVLYNVILAAILLFGVGFLASRLTFLRPQRVVLDFGLSALSISCGMIAVLIGSSLIGREFERRTVYVALSHPISRLQFVLGKFLGIAMVVCVNWLLLALIYVGLLAGQGGAGEMGLTFFTAIVLILVQSLVLSSLAILFSSVSTTSLSVILTLGLYLIGTNISELRLLALRIGSDFWKAVLNAIAAVLPNFVHFGLGMKLTYDLPVTAGFVAFSVLYGLSLILLFLLIAGVLIRMREV